MASRGVIGFGVLYVLLFGALGAEVPFLPPLLAGAGLSAPQIGVILTAGTLAQMVFAPLFGEAADRFGARIILAIAAVAAAASLLLFLAPSFGFATALLVYVLFAVAVAPLNPLADALSVPACLRAGIPYGRVRGAGSAGFFAGVLLSTAATARYDIRAIAPTAAILLCLVAVVAIAVSTVTHPSMPQDETGTGARARGGIRVLSANGAFRRVLLVAALVIGGHAMADAFAVIHWVAIGIGAQAIGILLALAVVSECLVFVLIGPMLLARLGPAVCATIGAAAGVIRWSILAETKSFAPLAAAQLMHGLTFSLVHLACMQVLAAVAPRRFFATAQSLYGICCNAVASSMVTLAAGALFATFRGQAFLMVSALCILALPVALRLGSGFDTGPRRLEH